MVLTTTPSPVPHFLSTLTVNNNNNNGYSANHRNHNRLLLLLNECTYMSQLKQIHAHTLRTTTSTHNPHTLFLYSRILHFSSLADFDYASRVFDQVQNPNSFMWNTLMRACARSFDRKEEAIQLYYRMLEEGIVMPDKHTFPFVLKACAYLFALFEGKQVHAHVLKLGYDSDVYINNSLIHLYGTCGCLDIAQKVFDIMPERSVVSWNVMIDAYVRLGEFDTALKLFREMQNMFEPDGYTMQSVISACAGLGALSLGMWTHACALRKCGGDAFDDVLVNNCLVDMYCKCGSWEIAQQVFERMAKRDVNSWNSMILGLAMHGKAEAALEYFVRMRTERFVPDSITFVGVLSACNHRGMVSEGRKYFDMMITEYKIEPKLEHYGCLVDLLARAGLIDEALNLVSDMPIKPDVVIWRSILDACCKKNAGVELSEEMASQILESEGGDCSGVYVLLSRVYASASRWDDVGLVRKLMIDKGVTKEPGCSSIEMNGTSHEFFAGDTSHPQSKEIYQVLDVIEERLKSVGHVPDFSQAPMVDELNNEKQHALKLHSERIAIAFGLLRLKPGMPIHIFKNLRVCDDCHKVTKLISRIYNVEIIVRDRARFHHFKDGTCSCMDYW
ncbi:pentatricopeptide repeat-containing protein At1g59720, chloroplastic/mitochondrial isoform X1 [Fagus crenata]